MAGLVTATPGPDHRFSGWSGVLDGCTLNGAAITVPMAQARTVTATVVSSRHTITLHPGLYGSIGGAAANVDFTASVTYGDAFPTVVVMPSAGLIFAGWSPAVSATVAGDINATAQYRQNDAMLAMAAAQIRAASTQE